MSASNADKVVAHHLEDVAAANHVANDHAATIAYMDPTDAEKVSTAGLKLASDGRVSRKAARRRRTPDCIPSANFE
jgi:hypothetical protein